MTTPLQVVLDAEIAALLALANKLSIAMDPETDCSGIVWAKKFIAKNPKVVLEDFQNEMLSSKEADKGAWISGLLGNQWENLPASFRDTLVPLIKGDECLLVVSRARAAMAAKDKAAIRQQYLSIHSETPGIFDSEIAGVSASCSTEQTKD